MSDIYGDQLSIAPSKTLNTDLIGNIIISPQIASATPTACIITGYTLQDQEKLQVTECFNEKIYTKSYGRRPRIITLQGYVEAQYGQYFMAYYEENRSYTNTANIIIEIPKLGRVIYGNIQGLTMNITGDTPNLYSFTLNIIEAGSENNS